MVELNGNVLYPDTLRYRNEKGGEKVLESAKRNVAVTRQWVVGSLQNSLGEPTPAAQVSKFFELSP